MPWVRKKFKKCKVYVLVDAQGQIVIENNLAQIKYRGVDDDKIYNARAEDIEDLENVSSQQSANTEKNTASTKTSKKKSDVKKDTPIQNTPNTSKPQNPASSQVEIYTDGACTGNPGPAGIGIYFRFGKHHKEISEYIGHATNNIAELTAIKKALESLKSHEYPVTIFSDSQYSLSVLNGAYKAKKNKELIESIQKLMSNFKYLKLVKVAGHSGIAGNEKADRLAVSAIENAKNG